MMNLSKLMALCMTALLVACGGGGGGGASQGPDDTPTGSRLTLMFADLDTDDVREIYIIDQSVPGVAERVNRPLTAANVDSFPVAYGPDFVLYITDHDTPGQKELYLSSLDVPGAAVRVNAPLVASGDVESAVLSRDGRWIAYLADGNVLGQDELFLVSVENLGVAVRVSGPLVAGGDVTRNFAFGPGSDRLFYVADEEVDEVDELFTVAIASPGASLKLSNPSAVPGDVRDFVVSPAGTQVAYRSNHRPSTALQLYRVNLSAAGSVERLNPTLVAGGEVSEFRYSPSGGRVVYQADADTVGQEELYVVNVGSPGVATRLNAPFSDPAQRVSRFHMFIGSSERLLYVSDERTPDVDELFAVDVATGGPPVVMSGPQRTGGKITLAVSSPDGVHVLYTADPDIVDVTEAFLVRADTPGVAIRANDTLVPGSEGVQSALFSEDGTVIQYAAQQDTPGTYELYIVPTDAPGSGTSTKLNPPLPATASVEAHLPFPVDFLLRQLGL